MRLEVWPKLRNNSDWSIKGYNSELLFSINCFNRAGSVHADEGVFDSLHHMRLEVWPKLRDNSDWSIKGYNSE